MRGARSFSSLSVTPCFSPTASAVAFFQYRLNSSIFFPARVYNSTGAETERRVAYARAGQRLVVWVVRNVPGHVAVPEIRGAAVDVFAHLDRLEFFAAPILRPVDDDAARIPAAAGVGVDHDDTLRLRLRIGGALELR